MAKKTKETISIDLGTSSIKILVSEKDGNNVTIKGFSYILGSKIGDNIFIEHSVLIKKVISKPADSKHEIFKVRFYTPGPEGIEAVKDLK